MIAGSRAPTFLGRIMSAEGRPVGTCFQVAPGVLVTAWHVLDQIALSATGALIRVEPLAAMGGDDGFDAVVARTDQLHDLAVATCDVGVLATSVVGLAETSSTHPFREVMVTGVPEMTDHAHTYQDLDAPGHWYGGATRDGQPLGQMNNNGVTRGMSGAPVRRLDDGVVIGVVSGRYNTADGWARDRVWVARVEDLLLLLDGYGILADLGEIQPPPGERVWKRIAPTTMFEPPRRERNPYFTGREETLELIGATLRPGEPTALRQAITGLGGVGKTELAVEYAHRRRELYDVIFTLRAATPATLAGDARRLAGQLGLSRQPNQLAARLRGWFDEHDRWLLIFDNAEKHEFLKEYVPSGGGHVVITARAREWGPLVSTVDVDVWRPDESVEFLALRLDRRDPTDKAAAGYVAEMLGHLPLALEQAAAYMRQRGTPYIDYVRMLETSADVLLSESAPADLGYTHTVASTWSVALLEIGNECPEGIELLQICTFLAPDAIPESLFRLGLAALSPHLRRVAEDEERLQGALGILQRYALVRRERGMLSIHRLVQHVVRQAMPPAVKRSRVATSVALLDQVFPTAFADPADDLRSSALLAHVLAAFPYAVALDGAAEQAHKLLTRAGEFMAKRAQLEGAQSSLDHAHAIATQTYGHDSPAVAKGLIVLGRALFIQSDLSGARACFERALAIAEPIFGARHSEVVSLLNELARTLRALGDLEGARGYLTRAISGGSR